MWRKKKYPVGKLVGNSLYIHKDYIYTLPDREKALAAEAIYILEEVGGIRGNWNAVVLYVGKSLFSPSTGFRMYDNFNEDPHPRLSFSYRVEPDGRKVTITKPGKVNYILHRKELLVGYDHSWRESWAMTTRQEEKVGLYDKEHICNIGRESYWNALLEAKGVEYHGRSLSRGSLYYVDSGKIVKV